MVLIFGKCLIDTKMSKVPKYKIIVFSSKLYLRTNPYCYTCPIPTDLQQPGLLPVVTGPVTTILS